LTLHFRLDWKGLLALLHLASNQSYCSYFFYYGFTSPACCRRFFLHFAF